MKYDFSIVINQNIRNKISLVEKYFVTKRTSTIISKIVNLMYPYLKHYHNIAQEGIPVYEKINWNKKIHIRLDFKVYLTLKKIYDDTNGYSIGYVLRRILDFFIENIVKHENIESFLSWLIKLFKKSGTILKKAPFDVWDFMKKNNLKSLGRLRIDERKREFSLNRQYMSIKYNEYLRPIEFSYK